MISLNLYTINIFESNQNNLNILKSLISRIIYGNIFYHQEKQEKINSQIESNSNNIKNNNIDLKINEAIKSKDCINKIFLISFKYQIMIICYMNLYLAFFIRYFYFHFTFYQRYIFFLNYIIIKLYNNRQSYLIQKTL